MSETVVNISRCIVSATAIIGAVYVLTNGNHYLAFVVLIIAALCAIPEQTILNKVG